MFKSQVLDHSLDILVLGFSEATEHTDTNHRLLASPPRVSDSGGLE